MGKKSRQKRERGDPHAADGASPRAEKTAFVEMMRGARELLDNEGLVERRLWAADGDEVLDAQFESAKRVAQVIARAAGNFRTVVVSPAQARVFLEMDVDWQKVSEEVRPPFDLVLFDFTGCEEEIELDSVAVGETVTGLVRSAVTLATDDDWGAYALVGLKRQNGPGIEGAQEAMPVARPGDVAGSARWGKDRSARIVLGTLMMMESANVELVESPYPRGHVAARTPRFEVVVRRSTRRYKRQTGSRPQIEYEHRFEVAGNYAHHYELTIEGTPNRLYRKWLRERPDKLVEVGGCPCFRVWREPYVKGPEDRPLVPKIRRLA